jgi:2-oxoglutarate dehydrogenase E2 component (dihydrolipoamide succinyltransferase)
MQGTTSFPTISISSSKASGTWEGDERRYFESFKIRNNSYICILFYLIKHSMAKYPVVVPRLGEAVIEATLTRWLKNEGDPVTAEEPIAEIATDKVDSEIVSPVAGVLSKKIAKEGDVIPVGQLIAELETSAEVPGPAAPSAVPSPARVNPEPVAAEPSGNVRPVSTEGEESPATRFYSPLVRSIARKEGIAFADLGTITGTGKGDRITKQDILGFIELKRTGKAPVPTPPSPPLPVVPASQPFIPGSGDTVVEMDRIRQLISAHMVKSVQTSPHVTSFAEADMTRIVTWRERNKETFQKKHGEKLTFTPIIVEAIAKAVRDFPMVNVSVDGTKIVRHGNINIGMAVALPNGNLIVPVVRNAGEMNLLGVIKGVNDLAERARQNKLVPDEITGGTISFTNLGSFGTLMGTPIINQPQCAIVAAGSIKKRPVVVETEEGDTISIRSIMIVSVTYDHRVIDGALGGKFLGRIVEYLEKFDVQQSF